MARAVAEIADVIWLTSDNPRFEDPLVILADARAGFVGSDRELHEELDRARAIERAILEAPERAVVLVAGKGHETYQLVRGERFEFDDRVRVRLALAERRKERVGKGL
jgi:UDP-N-acetylmuramoyl-L-alanyl-D-glutamate--2,6-diaminopimelate ligase